MLFLLSMHTRDWLQTIVIITTLTVRDDLSQFDRNYLISVGLHHKTLPKFFSCVLIIHPGIVPEVDVCIHVSTDSRQNLTTRFFKMICSLCMCPNLIQIKASEISLKCEESKEKL